MWLFTSCQNQFALVVFCRTFCGALFFPTIATFLGSTLFEEVVVFPQTKVEIMSSYVLSECTVCHVQSKFEIGTIAGAVTAETRRDGWILLCGSQGSAENLPQAEPIHTAVQAPDS